MTDAIYLTPEEITQEQVREICALKNQSWPHSMASQLAWWECNTDYKDVFVTLMSEDVILAFLRLRQRQIAVDDSMVNALCATEVCVEDSHQGQGLGKQLMDAATERLGQTGSCPGYLICHDTQQHFYEACNWHRINTPLQIESSDQVRRLLAENERCMAYDPKRNLTGRIVLFGDVF